MVHCNSSRRSPVLVGLIVALLFSIGSAKGDFFFGEPTSLGPTVNSPGTDFSACISADELSLFFSSTRAPGGFRDFDLWLATRQAKNEDWGAPVHLGDILNSRGMEWTPCISADGLELYFAGGTWGNTDISVARRNSFSEPWGAAESLGPTVNSTVWDFGPSISADGLELFFSSSRPGGFGGPDLYVTKRASTSDPWGPATNLGPTVNTAYGDSLYGEWSPSISHDGLTLFFASARPPGGATNLDIWMTRRATREDEWEPPVRLGPSVNSPLHDSSACISADGLTLYSSSYRSGGMGEADFWQVPILPIVDFNGDGMVDGKDVLIMATHWGQDDPSCDTGPTPFGDGVIDVQDLVVLAEYIGKDVNDPTLVAHWALDETGGLIAYDSVAGNHGFVVGEPVWQPAEGQVNGALCFDGVNDYVRTDPVLDPSDGPFSILAWIQGGAPGQVVVSQLDGTSWLLADPSTGNLMTDKGSGRQDRPLLSQTSITDGAWHRVGLVWDGVNRTLYVDDVPVAEDTPAGLVGSGGGLHIACGSQKELASFWSGLIDDVRIYNRVVTP